ncbi:hypothetical protein NP233_g8360 [Leucocoprinus birnbaumii]|uniref:DUF6535 domain-containing protein n=1 Tax=Leucocoprinus birnbaumii TaxID=56174 RepID=A0AAD5VPZ6_9AGAR|nr:hypothetical protein NP233_g8360 [Leucocoprinus birnbaumii]
MSAVPSSQNAHTVLPVRSESTGHNLVKPPERPLKRSTPKSTSVKKRPLSDLEESPQPTKSNTSSSARKLRQPPLKLQLPLHDDDHFDSHPPSPTRPLKQLPRTLIVPKSRAKSVDDTILNKSVTRPLFRNVSGTRAKEKKPLAPAATYVEEQNSGPRGRKRQRQATSFNPSPVFRYFPYTFVANPVAPSSSTGSASPPQYSVVPKGAQQVPTSSFTFNPKSPALPTRQDQAVSTEQMDASILSGTTANTNPDEMVDSLPSGDTPSPDSGPEQPNGETSPSSSSPLNTHNACPCHQRAKEEDQTNPWQTCSGFAKELIEEENSNWKDEVDKLLLFAALFSGVVTAFTLESYHAVQSDNPAQMTVLLMQTMVRQLDNMTNPQSSNSAIDLNPRIHVTESAKRVNTLWFTSLALSLSTAVLGMLCLQWIREANRSANIPHHRHLAIRYMRKEGMRKWRVFTILKLLPALLIAALLLFFAGLMEIIWRVDGGLATPATIIIGLTVSFVIFTTIAPIIQTLSLSSRAKQPQCPYKSPQAWILHKAIISFGKYTYILFSKCRNHEKRYDLPSVWKIRSWLGYDIFQLDHRQQKADSETADVGHALGWIAMTFFHCQDLAEAVLRCLRDLDHHVLEAFLARLDPRRGIAIRKKRDELIKNDRSVYDQQPGKVRYIQDLIVSHTLDHLAANIERRHMSTSLLQQRTAMFLRINRNEETMDVDIGCPVNRDNVNSLPAGKHSPVLVYSEYVSYENTDTKDDILRCINEMLQKNLDCKPTHIRGIFHILWSLLEAREPSQPVPAILSETLNIAMAWSSVNSASTAVNAVGLSPNDPEDKKLSRVKLATILSKLVFACKGADDWEIVDKYNRQLDIWISQEFGGEIKVDFTSESEAANVRQYPNLERFLVWQNLDNDEPDEPLPVPLSDPFD